MSPSTWRALGLVLALLLIAISVVGLVSTQRDATRLHTLRSRGLAVDVRVTTCIGNLGGSGSNAADYTCHGRYRVGTTTYTETIEGLSGFTAPSTTVRGVVDPHHPGEVTWQTALAHENVSASRYVISGGLSLVGLLLAALVVRGRRRASSSTEAPAATFET